MTKDSHKTETYKEFDLGSLEESEFVTYENESEDEQREKAKKKKDIEDKFRNLLSELEKLKIDPEFAMNPESSRLFEYRWPTEDSIISSGLTPDQKETIITTNKKNYFYKAKAADGLITLCYDVAQYNGYNDIECAKNIVLIGTVENLEEAKKNRTHFHGNQVINNGLLPPFPAPGELAILQLTGARSVSSSKRASTDYAGIERIIEMVSLAVSQTRSPEERSGFDGDSTSSSILPSEKTTQPMAKGLLPRSLDNSGQNK